MALSIRQVSQRVESMKRRYADRDARMANVLAVRQGNIEQVFPDFFPETLPYPMIANFIDVAARDLAEVLAPLPSFNCSTANVNSERAKLAAEKRTQIANFYVQNSRLTTQMYTGADWFLTFGFLPMVVELDEENRVPRVRLDSPLGAYPEFDRYNRLTCYARRYLKTIAELIAEFPEYESQIIGPLGRDATDLYSMLELIRYEDKDQIVLYVPQRNNLIINQVENPIGEPMVRVARRTSIDDDMRGQFDDVVWVQLARARFSLLALEAAEKSVQAPLALPTDVQELAFGPDAIIRTANPQAVRRVGLELPPAAFQEQAVLQQEMRLGARYPEGRSGQIDASIITGQGVQALLGAFDSQVKAGQQLLSQTFEDVISLCFRADEKMFPGSKTVRGLDDGAPYMLNYDPAKDIKGDYTVEVRYGLMSGLDPSRALIFSLQALGADLVSRDFVMRELPWSMDVAKEQQRIDIQRMRDNLNQALASAAVAIPQMVTQGQDPSNIIEKISNIIAERRKGTPIEDAAMKVFEEERRQREEAEAAAAEGQPELPGGLPPESPMGLPPGSPGATTQEAAPSLDISQVLAQIAR